MKRVSAAAFLAALLATATGAHAQSETDQKISDLEKRVESLVAKEKAREAEEAKAKAAKGTTLRSVFDGGKIAWESADGAYRFRLVGRLQVDGAFFSGSENRLSNGLTIRRGRIGWQARIAKDWTSEFEVDFAGNGVEVTDAFVGWEGVKGGLARAGNFKVPFGMDTMTSDNDIWFVEPAYVDAWSPGRRLGVGWKQGGRDFSAAADLYGQAISVDTSGVDQGWGWGVRGTWAPLLVSDTRAIHVGLAAAARRPDAATLGSGTLPPQAFLASFSARPESTTVSRAKFLQTATMAQVDWIRQYGAELAGVWDAFAWQAEFQRTSVTRRAGFPTLADHDFSGWYAQVSWVVAGGKRKYDGPNGLVGRVVPSGRSGAFELAARYSTMDLNDRAETDPIVGGSAKNVTLGASWYPNLNFRFVLNWTHVNNDEYAKPAIAYGGIPGDDFDEVQFRVQFAF